MGLQPFQCNPFWVWAREGKRTRFGELSCKFQIPAHFFPGSSCVCYKSPCPAKSWQGPWGHSHSSDPAPAHPSAGRWILNCVTKVRRFFWAQKSLQKDSPGCTAPLIRTFPLAGLCFPAPWAPSKSSCCAMEQLCCSPQEGIRAWESATAQQLLAIPIPILLPCQNFLITAWETEQPRLWTSFLSPFVLHHWEMFWSTQNVVCR